MEDAGSPYRIAANRVKSSSIPVICSVIHITFCLARHMSAIKVCKSQPDSDNGCAAERDQTEQFIQVSRDLIKDYSANYRVRVLRTDDLQFPFERLALHWSHISPDFGFSLLD